MTPRRVAATWVSGVVKSSNWRRARRASFGVSAVRCRFVLGFDDTAKSCRNLALGSGVVIQLEASETCELWSVGSPLPLCLRIRRHGKGCRNLGLGSGEVTNWRRARHAGFGVSAVRYRFVLGFDDTAKGCRSLGLGSGEVIQLDPTETRGLWSVGSPLPLCLRIRRHREELPQLGSREW